MASVEVEAKSLVSGPSSPVLVPGLKSTEVEEYLLVSDSVFWVGFGLVSAEVRERTLLSGSMALALAPG